MSAVKDELLRLIDDLPDEDLADIVAEVRGRVRMHAEATMTAEGHETPAASLQREERVWRWPHMGTGAVGAAILVGWLGGIAAGPLGAILGAVVGLIGGDQLDQHVARAETN